MKRYFDEDSSHYLALIDEAHNLVERSKEMYSASISDTLLDKARKGQRHIPNRKIKNALSRINKIFEFYDENYEFGETKLDDIHEDFYADLNKFVTSYQEVSKETNKDISRELTDLYLEVNRFLKISEFYSDKFVMYISKNEERTAIKL